MARIVVAPDSFKGCLPADQVAAALAAGLRHVGHEAVPLPLADGGEGTVAACLRAGFTAHFADVTGPTGARVETTIAFDGTTAVVELADACGFVRLPGHRPAPMTASTLGLGEAVLAALDLAPARIVLGLGGSASTDGGTGLLAALGAQLVDDSGAPVPLGGGSLHRVRRLDLSAARAAVGDVELVGATDVTSPLTGTDGAAHVFGPQKGADPAQVAALDAGLTNLARLAGFPTDLPGSGAAGGTGFAVLLLGGSLVSGADFVLDLVGLDAALAGADAVVTGEGRLDDTSAAGKLVGAVAGRARAAAVPVAAVVGNDARTRPDATLPAVALDVIAGDTSRDPAAALRALDAAATLAVDALRLPHPAAAGVAVPALALTTLA